MADSYEQIREKVIEKYKYLYKDALAFDICEVPKEIRVRLMNDPVYISKTKAIKANLFAEELSTIDDLLGGTYDPEGKNQSQTVLKALEMRNKLLFEDLNVTKDESNALNVIFTSMTREDFESMETVEVFKGGNSAELGADFGTGGDEDSFEARMKAKTQEKLKELEAKKKEED